MSSRRILVVTDTGLGDIVLDHSLFRLLKQGDPELEIDALVPPAFQGLVARRGDCSKRP